MRHLQRTYDRRNKRKKKPSILDYILWFRTNILKGLFYTNQRGNQQWKKALRVTWLLLEQNSGVLKVKIKIIYRCSNTCIQNTHSFLKLFGLLPSQLWGDARVKIEMLWYGICWVRYRNRVISAGIKEIWRNGNQNWDQTEGWTTWQLKNWKQAKQSDHMWTASKIVHGPHIRCHYS